MTTTETRTLAVDEFPDGRAGIEVVYSDDAPAALQFTGSAFAGRVTVPLVEVFTSAEQRVRSSRSTLVSAVGQRLRVVEDKWMAGGPDAQRVVVQQDATTGLLVRTVLTLPARTRTVRIETELRNDGDQPLTVTAVATAVGFARSEQDLEDVTLGTAVSEWLAEGRWQQRPLRQVLPTLSLDLHAQEARGTFELSSRGAWSTGEYLPVGTLVDEQTGESLAWQIESSAGWRLELAQGRDGGVLVLAGPNDVDHQFAHRLGSGERFLAVPIAIAVSDLSATGAIAELTEYRRWLRAAAADAGPSLPLVYNDFMNTLMGQPSTEKLLPLIGAAADAGAEVFCIDAGWFADPTIGNWWATVGEWREDETRFSGGLVSVVQAIIDRGMRPGLWLEPEVIGVHSPAASALPDEAFFHRYGQRVQESERFHLDFRHPAARAHLDATVDNLVETYGIGYLKLDYNIDPGAGTEINASSAGDGLLAHTRAYRDWLLGLQARHPGLEIENCASGAMRADYGLLAVTSLQSTSDQQDFRLYPPIAASAPAAILPEQCGNWAYPASAMTDEETVFTLVTGLSGRLVLSGFLDTLSHQQQELVQGAVKLYKELRTDLGTATPFWPCGMPSWDDEFVCLGWRTAGGDVLFVWDRSPEARTVVVPDVHGIAEQKFPATAPWALSAEHDGLHLEIPSGLGARVFRIPRT